MKQKAVVDVQQIIDRQAFGRFHLRVAALCAAPVLMDGFNAQAIGFVAPSLTAQWHIPRAALSPILSSGLVGMLVGSLVCGPVADRFGRKSILVLCTLWFGVFSLLTASANSPQSMVLLRLLTGFGLGGTVPNAVALTAEYMPKRLRATGVMLMITAFPVGAATGGLAAAELISRFGWQSVFLLGGVVPCTTAILLLALPESIRFLVLKGGKDAAVRKLLRRITPREFGGATEAGFSIGERRAAGFVVKHLFTEGRARFTLLLWLIFFMSLLDLYFLNSWLPTVLHDAGFVLERAIVITAMFQVGGAVASLVLGQFIDRLGGYRVLAWTYLGAALCIVFIGMVSAWRALEGLAVFAAGFCVIGGQSGANALAAEVYPTGMRATGSGWAMGIGRVGSIIGPIVGGVLLSSQLQMRRVFWVAALPPLIAAIAGFAVSPLGRGKPWEGQER